MWRAPSPTLKARPTSFSTSSDSTWFSFLKDKQTPEDVKNLITSAATGRYFRTDTVSPNAEGVITTTLVKVNQKKAPKMVYDFAECVYRVEPSDKTVNELRNDLQKFLTTNTRAENITTESAAKAGYMLQVGTVSPSSVQVGEVPYSREAVKWALDNKKGAVSPIFENEGWEEIKKGRSRQWLAVANGSMTVAVVGKLLPQTIIFSVVGVFVQSLFYGYYHLPMNGSILAMISAMILFVIANQSFAFILSALIPNAKQRLATSYVALLDTLHSNVNSMVKEGVATAL